MAGAIALVSLPDERASWVSGNKYFVEGTVTVSASPATYVTGGIPMSFLVPLAKVNQQPPVMCVVLGRGLGTTNTLFIYMFIPGTDASTGLLKIFSSNGAAPAGLVEIPASAIPADVSGDTIKFFAIFKGMQ